MRKAFLCLPIVLLALFNRGSSAEESAPPESELLTKAEASDYRATATYDEVMAFCRRLAERSDRVQLTTFGKSVEGRDLPLLILSQDQKVTADTRGDKLVVLALGNIHAGEVCGKEALLMLARDLTAPEVSPLLEHLHLLIAPIYNADGNEPFDEANRPGQVGPDEGVGRRANAQDLDLNRDFVKAEAPETRALLALLNDRDPHILIDTHTTNGSHHRYTLTYGGPRHPATASTLVDYMRQSFLPRVQRRLQASTGYDSFFYGNFTNDHRHWRTYPALPRYGVHYMGLRQRLAILSEAYAYAPYKDRVLATYGFVEQCLREIVEKREEIAELLDHARSETVDQGKTAAGELPLRVELAPFEEKITVKGYVEVNGEPTGEARDYEVEYWARSSVSQTVPLPFAYLVDPSEEHVVATLQRHGVEVETLREDLQLPLTVLGVEAVSKAEQAYQKHHLTTIEASEQKVTRPVAAGTLVIRTGQALGKLAAYLLEPEAEDGLFAWNAFSGSDSSAGQTLPVMRLHTPVTLLTAPLPERVEEASEAEKRVTFEALYGDDKADFEGDPTSVEWLEDGQSFLQTREGKRHRVDAVTGRPKPLYDEADLAKSLAGIAALTDEERAEWSERSFGNTNHERTAALVDYGDDLYLLHFDGTPAKRLTNTPGAEEMATFSPDDAFVAFVREQNLYAVDVASQTERALTTDGGGDISNGKADWVYFEELYGRNWKAFWWSPDSRHLAYHRFDAARLPMFHALDTLPLHGELRSMRHPKAGDPNPLIQLGVTHVAGGATRWVDLSTYTEGAYLISHVGWTPTGKALYFYVQDRAQKWLDFRLANPRSGTSECLFRDETEAWVESPGESWFLGESEDVLFLSERSGWRHLYRFDREDKGTCAMTSGEWEIREVSLVDEENGWIYFRATKDSLIAENLYRCRLDGTDLVRLTEGDGWHRVDIDPEGRFFVDSHSSATRPTQVRLYRTDGSFVRTLDTNPVPALDDYMFGKFEMFQIPAQDGFLLEAALTYPPDFDASRAYPVWLTTYGGPQAPTIRDAWSRSWIYAQMLAEMGIVVFQLDPRSASGKGARSAWTAYRRLGEQELADIREGLAWLKTKPYIDPARIGMSGHSYGGFLTAYAMTHSDLFSAGISGAPVTDWHYYDSIYTERYMDTPQENPEGYENTSVVKAAKDLHGKLLLLHGMMDDNVHLQNSTQLVKALQEADKDFRVMFYPEMLHGLHGKHYRRLLVDFIRETMGVDSPVPSGNSGPSGETTGSEPVLP